MPMILVKEREILRYSLQNVSRPLGFFFFFFFFFFFNFEI